jgi:cytochrome c biogenesis protein CcdA
MSTLPFPIAAFAAGFVSFLTPCVLPLIPGYISLLSGLGLDELRQPGRRVFRSVLSSAILLILGFSAVFGFGWTPCLGPILAVIIAFAAGESTMAKGTSLLAMYSLGLAIPFLLAAVSIERFLAFYHHFRSHLHTLELMNGAVMIVLGLVILTHHYVLLVSWMNQVTFFRKVAERFL